MAQKGLAEAEGVAPSRAMMLLRGAVKMSRARDLLESCLLIAITAQLLYAPPSRLVCTFSGCRQCPPAVTRTFHRGTLLRPHVDGRIIPAPSNQLGQERSVPAAG
jgi:hypothetical protein